MKNLLSTEEMNAVIYGNHDNVFAVLGPHKDKGSKNIFIRAFLPHSNSVFVLSQDGKKLGQMTQLDDKGFYQIGGKRPTAKEWCNHLNYLMSILKECKKDKNHVYFTNKGCGLCVVEEKFKLKFSEVEKEKKGEPKIRGFEVGNLTTEKTQIFKKMKQRAFGRLNRLAFLLAVTYFVLWTILPIYAVKYKDFLSARGFFVQVLIGVVILKGVFFLLNYIQKVLPLFQNTVLLNMLKIYALINTIVCFFAINGFEILLIK